MKEDQCVWPRCKQWADMNYLGKLLCWKHWTVFCDMEENNQHKQARRKIGLSNDKKNKTNKK